MMNYEWEDSFQEDWNLLPPDAIILSQHQLDQASRWSRKGYGEPQQWQIYRHGLALLGFTQWLGDRGVSNINLQQQSLSQTVPANLLDAVTGISVGQYQVALWIQEVNAQPALPLLLYHYQAADFYIGIHVWEETGHVQVMGGIWHTDLASSLASSLSGTEERIEISPQNLLDIDQVLLSLKCASWPPNNKLVSTEMTMAYDVSPQYLKQKLSQWTELSYSHEILNLQERVQVLKSTSLAEEFQSLLDQTFQPSFISGLNVGQWWARSRDKLEQDFGWTRLPQLNLALRSTGDENSEIVGRLCDQGIDIPEHAQASYQDLQIATQSIRLYAVAWPCLSSALRDIEVMDWSLLLVVCTMPAAALSNAIHMEVRDEGQALATQELLPHKAQACSYIQVSGTKDEQFWVTLSEVNQPETALTLPPFFFSPPESS